MNDADRRSADAAALWTAVQAVNAARAARSTGERLRHLLAAAAISSPPRAIERPVGCIEMGMSIETLFDERSRVLDLRRTLCRAVQQPLWPASEPMPPMDTSGALVAALIRLLPSAVVSDVDRQTLRGCCRAALRSKATHDAAALAQAIDALAGDAGLTSACDLFDVAVDEMLGVPSCRLAVYGTLAPGEPNHGVLADVEGVWRMGTTRGELRSWRGYRVLAPDERGREVAVHWLSSPLLPTAWARIDEFEGPRYRRALTIVETNDGVAIANVYADAHQVPSV